jgi:2'-5' RNA ligase
MVYRYYIGLDLPEQLSKPIAEVQQELFTPSLTREPLEPHITLLPPPAVEQMEPQALGAQAQAVAADLLPLTLRLTDVITFDRRAIVINVEGDAVYELQARLAKLLPSADQPTYAPLARFHPHITLSQAVRGKQLPEPLLVAYRERLATSLPTTCVIGQLTLYEWVSPRRYSAHSL